MRTTVDIDDELLRRLKRLATEKGSTVQGLVNDLLKMALAKPPKQERYEFRLQGWKATLPAGVSDDDVMDRSRLYDLLDPHAKHSAQ